MLKLISGPSAPVIDLEKVKAHLRLEASYNDENEYLTDVIARAYGIFSREVGYPLVLSEFEQTVKTLTADMTLALPNVTEVTSITYFDAQNSAQTLDTSSYTLQGQSLVLTDVPETKDRTDAATFNFKAGAESLADDMVQALLTMISDIYELRSSRIDYETFDAAPYLQRYIIHAHRRMPI